VVSAFIDAHRDRFGVEPVCRVLSEHGVKTAPSSYYAARTRPPSARAVRDERVLAEIRRVWADRRLGRGLAGVRKVYHLLARAGGVDGVHVPRCQVERLMRAAGLQGVRRGRKPITTTRPDPAASRAPDLVRRNFTAEAPNRLWLVDFTYVPTWSGTCFTAFVSDACSRRIVGWRTAESMPTQLPLDALEMALWTRQRAGQDVDGVIHHSDAGSQYTAIRYTSRLADAGAVASIGTVGDSYDNAEAESLIGLYKAECVRPDGPFRGLDDLELATLSWVHWFNHQRLHSAIAYATPVEHETAYHAAHPQDRRRGRSSAADPAPVLGAVQVVPPRAFGAAGAPPGPHLRAGGIGSYGGTGPGLSTTP
jgi:putative transposase